MFILIDGDVLVYSCGFASQKNAYTVGKEQVFQYKKDAKVYAKTRGFSDEDIVKTIHAEPVSHALQNVKQTLLKIAEDCDSHDGTIYLSGKGNYREEIAVTHPYKGTRDPDHKPVHYQAIKDYLVKHWDAEVVDGMEADDAMGIAQIKAMKSFDPDPTYWDQPVFNNETCICTIDKDLDMIPGWHYNIRKGNKYFVNLEEADYFFHKQMLTGDNADNIKGIYGVGDKKSDKMLRGKTPDERVEVIKRAYKKEFGKDADLRYKENSGLLWILREPLSESIREPRDV
jgi:hypothetical protein